MTAPRNRLAMVVVVEGDLAALECLTRSLHEDGFDVLPAASAEEGLSYFATVRPEILVVDLGLPGAAGPELIRRLRDRGSAAAGRLGPDLKVVALWPAEAHPRRFRPDVGADVSIGRPFEYDALRERLEGMIREDWSRPIIVHDLRIDPALGREVEVGGRMVELSRAELFLARTLARDPARPFTREQLLCEVMGKIDDSPTRGIDQHAAHLRRKLDHRFVFSCRGIGYRLVRG